jgi:hypothetical protein
MELIDSHPLCVARVRELEQALYYIRKTANRFRVVPADGSEILAMISIAADDALREHP